MKSEYVLMDFDGVIANTFQMCYEISCQVWPGLTREQYVEKFKGDVNETLTEIKSAGLNFFALYSARILDQKLVTGMDDMLKFLGQNFTMILVSSTESEPIKEFLRHHHLLEHFSAIFGNDVPSSKRQKIQLILGHYKIKPSECVLVTDTLGDLLDAKGLGVPSIAVTWGYHNEKTLRGGEPVSFVDYPTQLKGAIEEALEFSNEYEEGLH